MSRKRRHRTKKSGILSRLRHSARRRRRQRDQGRRLFTEPLEQRVLLAGLDPRFDVDGIVITDFGLGLNTAYDVATEPGEDIAAFDTTSVNTLTVDQGMDAVQKGLNEIPSAQSDDRAELLQFTAGGHVLGFGPDTVYVAAGDHALQVEFVGVQDVLPQSDGSSDDAQGMVADLSHVSYVGLWDGITLSYDAVAGGIAESTYALDPGADPNEIRLQYNVPVEIDEAGELVMTFETGQMRESAPVAWQYVEGQRVPVDVLFHKTDDQEVGFALGEYNSAWPLTIDPTLTWNTFLGGNGYDVGRAIAVDGSGNVYVGGSSNAPWGSPQRAYTPGDDAFAAKLASDGSLAWHTFLGGSGSDYGRAIAVDGSGNVYVGGYSDVTWGEPVTAYAGGLDAFVAKLTTNDGSLTWNTFLGGSRDDVGRAIAIDASGNAYVGGHSDATWGLPKRAYTSGDDAFAAKLATNGSLTWNTFLGDSGSDYGAAIAVDGSGNVYVGGNSSAPGARP